jgi:hypothetical protein
MSRYFSRVSERLLSAFAVWFASRAGVWQTLFATSAIVIGERLFPHVDPNGFWLLYVLTVYSAVTQPALAYTGQQSAERLDAMQRDHAALLKAIHAMMAQQNALLATLRDTDAYEVAELERIEEMLTEQP